MYHVIFLVNLITSDETLIKIESYYIYNISGDI